MKTSLNLKNILELSVVQQKAIRGGASFAYRAGQIIRFLYIDISGGPILGTTEAITDLVATEVQNK